ncbi:MAG: bifunctional phosphoribosylaminoimidazolecarboxamide formyltransferase/IMP cyclohydrolase [Planctomycetia bacterium]|nr:bifunctional phosphoribosylaminoimidazolecarboxamide formyltransferase/IMP cyclohydrolase [Planctomycetia bacterium]
MSVCRVHRAIISVSDKQGLVEFAQGLIAAGVELYSTGGTRKHLADAGVTTIDVADYTGFPEMMDGRVKTLHPKIHGGILCRRDHPEDMQALEAHGIRSFELVVVNLYPFEATVARADVAWEEAVEQIDIGGPSLVRAAAKNHAFVGVVTSPGQYAEVLAELQQESGTTFDLRKELAGAAFEHTSQYDRAIADYFAKPEAEVETFPAQVTLQLERQSELRYGENPHQRAALYANQGAAPQQLVHARQLHGKELSYNNWLDLDSAWSIVRSLPGPAVTVIKHNNPCGAATAAELSVATRRALDGDPVSAFGSILALNRTVDAATATVLAEPGLFVEAILAPSFDRDALRILTTKPKWKANVRLLELGKAVAAAPSLEFRRIDGGYLVQDTDVAADPESEWRVATEKSPDDELLSELKFAWAIVRFVKSNAIVIAKDGLVLGVGAGQMSRVDSVEIALKKSGDRVAGSVLASDAFFPFPDSIEHAAKAGVRAFIQPGGSKNDDASIAACNQHGLTMILTGRRHFRH